jgi:hypothetical protein
MDWVNPIHLPTIKEKAVANDEAFLLGLRIGHNLVNNRKNLFELGIDPSRHFEKFIKSKLVPLLGEFLLPFNEL